MSGFAVRHRSGLLAGTVIISVVLSISGMSLAAQVAPAHAARSATRWTKIAADANLGVGSSVGLLRTGDGRLHVAWSRHDPSNVFSLHYSTVGGRAKLLATGAIESHWASISFVPSLVPTPKGGLRVIFAGADGVNGSPYNNDSMYTATSDSAGKSWKLVSGSLSRSRLVTLTDSAAAVEPNKTPVAAWSEVSSLAYHVGIDPHSPAKSPDQHLGIGTGGGLMNPTLIQTKNGTVLAGWFNNSGKASAGYWVAQISPSKGTRIKAPHSGSSQANGQPFQPVALVARQGGGNYLAYCVATTLLRCRHIALWRVGAARALTVPGSSSGKAAFVAMSADRGGHLWIAWFDTATSKISLIRTNAAATRFGQVRVITIPPKLFDFEGLRAEGSAGPVDLLALEEQTNHTSAWFDTQLDPALRIRASKSSVSSTHSTTITFRVDDAGDGVAGAKVTFLGHTAKTNSKGVVNFTVKKGTAKGKHTVIATNSGYVSATFTVRVT